MKRARDSLGELNGEVGGKIGKGEKNFNRKNFWRKKLNSAIPACTRFSRWKQREHSEPGFFKIADVREETRKKDLEDVHSRGQYEVRGARLLRYAKVERVPA